MRVCWRTHSDNDSWYKRMVRIRIQSVKTHGTLCRVIWWWRLNAYAEPDWNVRKTNLICIYEKRKTKRDRQRNAMSHTRNIHASVVVHYKHINLPHKAYSQPCSCHDYCLSTSFPHSAVRAKILVMNTRNIPRISDDTYLWVQQSQYVRIYLPLHFLSSTFLWRYDALCAGIVCIQGSLRPCETVSSAHTIF